jgi:hypothetical protein
MDDSCWMLQSEDGETIVALTNVHHPIKCHGEHCIIHKPSEHHMRLWPLLYYTGGRFERACPHHLGHPDPDALAFARTMYPDSEVDFHPCDGCCRTQKRPIRYIRPTGLPPT